MIMIFKNMFNYLKFLLNVKILKLTIIFLIFVDRGGNLEQSESFFDQLSIERKHQISQTFQM